MYVLIKENIKYKLHCDCVSIQHIIRNYKK